MKSVSARIAAAAMLLATALAGCASETTTSDSFGSVEVNLIVGSELVTSVEFVVTCGELTLNGEFNVNDEQDPPVWATIMDLPVGVCTVTIIAKDAAGATLCTSSAEVEVLENESVKVNLILTCIIGGVDPVGNLDIDATFEIIEGNSCPRLHFLNVVPDEVPPEGSAVTVLVSDADGDTVTTALIATGGSFGDPAAQLTTYTCDDANGTQTVSVTASDGDPACDKSKSFDVTCPGVNRCEGVVCDDTGNPCTVEECNPANGQCEVSNVANGDVCEAGGIDDVADNGGVEEGTLNGWTDQEFCVGICEATDTMPNTGVYSARMFNDVAPSGSVLKQANKGIGIVQPNSQVTVRFAAKGNFAAGGVAVAEFFSEIAGGGTSGTEILGGGPFFTETTTEYQLFEFIVTTGNDVSGGVTLQFVAATGAATGSTSELFIDDVVIIVEGGGAGTCQEGVCEPSAECTVETVDVDCPPTNNECIDPVCNAGTCGTSNNTNACEGGTGTCSGGQCVPNALALYAQDFEPPMDVLNPNALIEDTAAEVPLGAWLLFGNVFDGTQDPPTFKFPFGPFGAPNATADTNPNDGQTFVSAVVTGEGDTPQGAQQLSVFSDYNCCDPDPLDPGVLRQGHGNGTDLVQINVFQELNPIPNSLIGQTLTFSFDAKRGNIEGVTTALAFITTLDPGAGFAQTNFVPIDLTNIPATWDRYSITLDLTAPELEGQILQVGFRNTAGNFEGSGIFYDNVLATLTPTAP